MTDMQNMNCKNCNTEVNLNYCHNCGQAVKLKRINGHYIIHEIEHVLHFEKGILFTIRELLIRPGENIRQFLNENRSRLVKPIIFIIITSLLYTLIDHFFHIEEGFLKIDETKRSTKDLIFKWVRDHYGYANIIMGMFIVPWIKLFFRKHNYNFFEILILLCFVMGMGMFIYAVLALIQGIAHINLVTVTSVIAFAYTTWAIGQFFDGKKPVTYVKAFVSYMLGASTFWLSASLLGTLIDLIIK